MNLTAQQERDRLNAQIRELRTRTWGLRGTEFPDHVVERAIGIVDRLDIATYEQREAALRKGPGGRKSTVPLRALLTALVLGALHQYDYLATVWRDILYRQISPTMRAKLGLGDPPEVHDTCGWKARYRAVLRRFHRFVETMDPSRLPRNRLLAPAEFKAQMRQDLSDEEVQERYDRLTVFVNDVIELSLDEAPNSFKERWKGCVGLDATNIKANTTGNAYEWPPDIEGPGPIRLHGTEPESGPYSRGADHRDLSKGNARGRAKKFWYAFEASFAIAGADSPDSPDFGTYPCLVVGMAPLHKPGEEPGRNGIIALRSIAERGHPVGLVAADRAYTQATPESFAYPARELGYGLVLDYKVDQLGIKGGSGGALLIEGTFYCPSIPKNLINATSDYRAKLIDEDLYTKRIAARASYAFRPNGSLNPDGSLRMLCPAAGAAPTARCAHKPGSTRKEHAGKARVNLNHMLATDPPKCCKQSTITIPAKDLDRYAQHHPYATDAWHDSYSLLRNAIEGANGHLKDEAGTGIQSPSSRRIRGRAEQSVLIAFAIFSMNIARIIAFAFKAEIGDDGNVRNLDQERERRRRATRDRDLPPLHLGDPPAEVA